MSDPPKFLNKNYGLLSKTKTMDPRFIYSDVFVFPKSYGLEGSMDF